ncbi:DUF4333 domain-containing protein [Streptomyces sp. AS02]|uniref:DUF4333 domain-containing protein n=1 Tax=Streptomyces sp. AS02 TaxID=2938946 RepID=UPI0020201F3B|nr:DUF4333 domain-containing protein [Streptomyces sp. AS02]MCL8015840.1 DUF4333 domain-containing protein [Streptomyces sp. AS02]
MAVPRLFAATSILSAVAVGTLLTGCSASVNVEKPELKMSAEKLANLVAEKLAATANQPKPDVTCPEDVPAKVGTTTRCKLTADDGTTLGVTATVSSVEGTKMNFDIQADETPTPAPS